MKQPDFTSDIGIGMLWIQGVRVSTLSESDKKWAYGKRLSIRTAAVHPDSGCPSGQLRRTATRDHGSSLGSPEVKEKDK